MDIVTAGIIEPLVARVLERAAPEEELAALQNLGATHDQSDAVKSHMARVGAIPAVLRHLKPRDCNTTRLAAAVVLNLAIEAEDRKTMLCDAGACEMVSSSSSALASVCAGVVLCFFVCVLCVCVCVCVVVCSARVSALLAIRG